MSPGYPSDYPNNKNCTWLISTKDSSKRVQVEVISMELANWDGGQCEDYLELRDGKDETSSTPVKSWCSTDQFQYKTNGAHLFVKFVADQHFSAPGFALKYYLIDDYESKCDTYRVRTISVGENPIFLDLPKYTEEKINLRREIVCDFHIKSTFSDDVYIGLEMLSFRPITCDEGNFNIYDGPNDDGAEILNWCSSNQPFRYLASSGKDLFIRFKIVATYSDWLVFRAKVTTNIRSTHCSDSSIPNLELTQLPVYLPFPHFVKIKSTRACPLRFWTEKDSQSVRLEVITKDPPCGNKGTRAHDGFDLSKKLIGNLCDEKIFTSTSHNMVLNPVNEMTTELVYLKASAVESTCNGQAEIKYAIHDEIKHLPEIANAKSGYPHDLNCNYLIKTERNSDVVEISIKGRLVPSNKFDCKDGDRVTFYDGPNTDSHILLIWCGVKGQGRKVTSTGPSMLVVVHTDSTDSYDGVNMTYYAFPKRGGCERVSHLEANSTLQHLTSPNYPLYYPINSYCEYKIHAPDGHFIKLEVSHSKMESDCSDTVQVYNGLEKKMDKYIGRWCGDDRPKYRSTGSDMLVVFNADMEFNSGGFNATFYAAKPEEENSHLVPIIVGTLLVAVAIIITIALVYIFVVRKKGKQ
ncbi:cubilin-like [Physella acuta]|uniref:cubilin-like n=1 Tax=Physella acuta TaxID=109671 RepID=UPI0027DB60CE|nr:cubilin-like [Physella acuta]